MQPLLDSLAALKKEFVGDPAVLKDIESEIEYAEEWIAETAADDKPRHGMALVFGDVDVHEHEPPQVRSIFDDVDE
jgi:hypothetical protein